MIKYWKCQLFGRLGEMHYLGGFYTAKNYPKIECVKAVIWPTVETLTLTENSSSAYHTDMPNPDDKKFLGLRLPVL